MTLKNSWWLVLVIILVISVSTAVAVGSKNFSNRNIVPDNPLFSCLDESNPINYHLHPVLSIIINGEKQVIPANIGITGNCAHPLHTHDDTGTIHVEYYSYYNFTLGDFFTVWGKAFDQNQIMDYKADNNHTVKMTLNGQINNEYGKLTLHDGDQILITYEKK